MFNPSYYPQPFNANMGQNTAYYPYNTQSYPLNNALSGRIVNNESEIMASEVPMDGSFAIFPKRDQSAVIIKKWNSNGTIATAEYVKSEQTYEDTMFLKSEDTIKNTYEEIKNAILRLEEKIDGGMANDKSRKRSNAAAKKQSEPEE